MVDDTDFEWLNQWKWYAQRDKTTYYAVRTNKRGQKPTRTYMHRLILGLTDRKQESDHVDRNGLNNQRRNLRTATRSQNMKNRMAQRNKTSKYLGVCWMQNRWVAQIQSDNERPKQLGRFTTELEAAMAYNEAAIKLHGEFANLNTYCHQ